MFNNGNHSRISLTNNSFVRSLLCTRVFGCLGVPGTTYLYQQLRLFSLPWDDGTIAGGALLAIKELNDSLKERAEDLIEEYRTETGHVAQCAGRGSANFNLTLINAALTNTRGDEGMYGKLIDIS
jgi:hypothetical protein